MKQPESVIPSIAKIVREIIDEHLTIQDSLERNYGNYSGIARIIKKDVEKITKHKVKDDAIITAFKRLSFSYKENNPETKKIISKTIMNVRTNLSKLSVEKNKKNESKIREVVMKSEEEIIQISQGTSAITVIYDNSMRKLILKKFKNHEILEDHEDLAAIILHSPTEFISTPGCAFSFYSQLAKRKINIEDTVSSYTDTVIVVDLKDVGSAFSALSTLVTNSRTNNFNH